MAEATTLPTLPLADIHLPNAPGIWPLAWGWWVAILLICIAMAYLVMAFKKQRRYSLARREALQHLTFLKSPEDFSKVNLLLRQVAMSYHSREYVAGLTGQSWLAFLDQHLEPKDQGFIRLSETWQQGLFSPAPLEKEQFVMCYQQAQKWIRKAKFHTMPEVSKESGNV
ncbi:DUF4381 domain-containing protein [Photobacterium gaetbulicola]|uniref:DUF4381 domain-containing protein n=2 Tax=Photobacterium gaetbulicola TaxID=1295392 RepID=A0A0C5WEP2_9GAMM|nr:DUF4381 domain-containing protein [Photobacterium gaetbulicola]AJR05598.1 hypothetical protein H744_1c0573 [Photobacterium gaetbulicola Gung47]KHT63960.1 hypothetical protein RJ45_09300 [Photobacterium gaetbulicola]PSU14579.1 DUF4381 domain-containing protein [Photobacterium gaetbulicola]